jgi:hypothetical protein
MEVKRFQIEEYDDNDNLIKTTDHVAYVPSSTTDLIKFLWDLEDQASVSTTEKE